MISEFINISLITLKKIHSLSDVIEGKNSDNIFNSLWPNDAICIDLGQHWLMQWLVAWRHQAIAWTNVDLSSVRSSYINLMAISQKINQSSMTKTNMKITHLKCHINLPEANESNLFCMGHSRGILRMYSLLQNQIWCRLCNICNVFKNMFNVGLKIILQSIVVEGFPTTEIWALKNLEACQLW